MKRDFLSLSDLTRDEVTALVALARQLKGDLKSGRQALPLAGKALALIFEKPSLRTRVTFEIGVRQLGGHSIHLGPDDIGLGDRESVADVARNLDRWVDVIVARTFSHLTLIDLARYARVPVINGLSDLQHPCQLLADYLTVVERFGHLEGLKVGYIGDPNNVAHSWITLAALLPFELVLAAPTGYDPSDSVVAAARAAGAHYTLTREPAEAAREAHVLYTDVWTSMGQEKEAAKRRKSFAGYRIDEALLKLARPDAIVMHCLPAHRGEEITDGVIEGPQSVVFDQAENRLHAHKAVLQWLLVGPHA